MKKHLLTVALFFALLQYGNSQQTILRAFPITDYIVDISDSVKLVQVNLPDAALIKEKQLGLLRSVYKTTAADTFSVGYGRCNLIKGNYYYFTIQLYPGVRAPLSTDLLYTMVPKTTVFEGQCLSIAAHYIQLDNVYDIPFFDRVDIFNNWTASKEKSALDSMVSDIRFTGSYFLNSDSSLNKEVMLGIYKGKKVLDVMINSTAADLKLFLDYIIIRPRIYAGRQWKVSELYATWITEGAPARL